MLGLARIKMQRCIFPLNKTHSEHLPLLPIGVERARGNNLRSKDPGFDRIAIVAPQLYKHENKDSGGYNPKNDATGGVNAAFLLPNALILSITY